MKKILGVNVGHDSGACLIRDGRLVTAINEERLSRVKLHTGFPYKSIEEVLTSNSMKISELDLIAVEGEKISPIADIGFSVNEGNWMKRLAVGLGLDRFLLGTNWGLKFVYFFLSSRLKKDQAQIKAFFHERGFRGEFEFVDHHLCHAASAYYTTPSDEGLAITLDASGEGICSKVYRCKNNQMEFLSQIPCYHSPAYYYAYITQLLGFKALRHEGKITGLAAFGQPEKVIEILERMIFYSPEKGRFVNRGGYHGKAFKRLKTLLAGFSKEDVAAGIQVWTERLMVSYVEDLIRKHNDGKPTAIFSAGGLFANVKMNQRIAESPLVSSMSIYPNMGDGGLNVGAALVAAFSRGVLRSKVQMADVYLGKDYTDSEIESILKKKRLKFRKSENIARDIAELIKDKKVVARFNGRMEFGPRALGNRSIVYSAEDRSVNDWLNKRLNRTEFMPFAPFVRDVDVKKYFKVNGNLRPFWFMTMTCDVTDICEKQSPGIVHVDGTARPQIVERSVNPSYYDILTEYDRLTGVGVLVNTSFNMHEEPIVNSPEEAVETFQQGHLDALAIGNYLVMP